MAVGEIMEHRLDKRRKLVFPVGVSVQDNKLHGGFTRNIGPGGMFIELDTSIKASCFEVHIFPEFNKNNGVLKIPVFVIHRSKDGVGVMIWGTDKTVERELKLKVWLPMFFDRTQPAEQVPRKNRRLNNKSVLGSKAVNE